MVNLGLALVACKGSLGGTAGIFGGTVGRSQRADGQERGEVPDALSGNVSMVWLHLL
jgi:hypothetical protein